MTSPRLLLSVLLLLHLLPTPALPQTISPSELSPGDRGYGLSVFSGTTIARFDVTVIGVLPGAMAGQDLVLIRCAGQNLEHSRIVAGMSGSPIYIRDRLLGALAYGWAFSSDPIAGVTPIGNMLQELRTTSSTPRPAAPPAGLTRLATPLQLSGIPARVLEAHEPALTRLGWLPMAGAAPLSGSAPLSGAVSPLTSATAARRTQLAPGSAIAVHMIRGDLSAAAIGTVTYRSGGDVLAFGHPLQGAGQVSLPAGPASILTVLPRLNTSFKLGVPLHEEGSMVWDGQAGITIDTARPARMRPIVVNTQDRRRGVQRAFRCEVADNPVLTPMLVEMVIGSVLETAGGSSDDVTTSIRVEATFRDDPGKSPKGGGRTLVARDLLYVGRDGLFAPQPLARVLAPLSNAFGRVDLASLTCDLDFLPGRRTAILRRVMCSAAELTAGRPAALDLVFKPYDGPEVTHSVRFPVPRELAGGELDVQIQPGSLAATDAAPPDSVADVFAFLARRHRADEVVFTFTLGGRALNTRGRTLKRLPKSILPILESPTASGSELVPEIHQVVHRTPWVLSGAARLKIPVKEVALE